MRTPCSCRGFLIRKNLTLMPLWHGEIDRQIKKIIGHRLLLKSFLKFMKSWIYKKVWFLHGHDLLKYFVNIIIQKLSKLNGYVALNDWRSSENKMVTAKGELVLSELSLFRWVTFNLCRYIVLSFWIFQLDQSITSRSRHERYFERMHDHQCEDFHVPWVKHEPIAIGICNSDNFFCFHTWRRYKPN